MTNNNQLTYDPSWDLPHDPGPEPNWQESDCYWFFDTERQVGGYHRIGLVPNAKAAAVMLFAFDSTGERYLGHRSIDWSEVEVSTNGRRAGGHFVESLGEMQVRYGWSDPDCEADLRFEESFYEPRDWHRGLDNEVSRSMNRGGHLECSGRLRGSMCIGSREYKIDALAHRDRSWGPRDWQSNGQHRMFSGTVGPKLSFAAFNMTLRDGGPAHTAGFVVRDGATADVVDLRVLVNLDRDGMTVFDGTAYFTLDTGEVVKVECDAVQGFMTGVQDAYAATSNLARVEFDGTVGFTVLDLTNNPGLGTWRRIPTQQELTLVCATDGLSPAASYKL